MALHDADEALQDRSGCAWLLVLGLTIHLVDLKGLCPQPFGHNAQYVASAYLNTFVQYPLLRLIASVENDLDGFITREDEVSWFISR